MTYEGLYAPKISCRKNPTRSFPGLNRRTLIIDLALNNIKRLYVLRMIMHSSPLRSGLCNDNVNLIPPLADKLANQSPIVLKNEIRMQKFNDGITF